MPTINITMDDSAVGASAGGGVVDVSVEFAASYTDAEAVGAMGGATITPGQVGTPDDPVGETHAESGYVDELSVTNVGVRCWCSTNQSIPESTPTDVAFDNATFDHYGWLDTSTGTVTVSEEGVYRIYSSIRIDNVENGATVVGSINVNGDTVGRADVHISTDRFAAPQVNDVQELNSGDSITSALFAITPQGNGCSVRGVEKDAYMTVTKLG